MERIGTMAYLMMKAAYELGYKAGYCDGTNPREPNDGNYQEII
jgi:hypothetical protein